MSVTADLILLGLLSLLLGAAVVAVQLYRQRLFSMLNFAAGLFLLEAVGGAIKALMPGIFPDYAANDTSNPMSYMPQAMVMYICGFALFVYGYACAAWLLRVPRGHRDAVTQRFFSRVWTPSYRFFLWLVTLFALAAGFVQQYQRIRSVGGLLSFIETAYQHRWGTATEGGAETAIVVIANLAAGSAVAFAVMWLIAWFRGKLTTFEKVAVVALLVVLLVRQWSTMFRATLMFTLLSLFAAYAAERRLKAKPLIIVGLMLAIVFVGVNFGHLYLYYLTAGWDKPAFGPSVGVFLGPHGHLYTLATVVGASREGLQPLGGVGLLENVFFFVPRAIWTTKLDSSLYGTVPVQAAAGLPTHYQMAVTAVGELFAHFRYFGVALMVLYGALYGVFDAFAERGIELRAALFGVLLGRVLADVGMGLSASSITIVALGIFLAQAWSARVAGAFTNWVLGGLRRRGSTPAPLSGTNTRAPLSATPRPE